MSKNSSNVSNENKQRMLFWPKLVQKWILGTEFWKSNSDSDQSFQDTMCVNFQAKTDIFDFFSPNLPKHEFCGQSFKNVSPDWESASPRYYVYQFLGKTDSFHFRSINLPKNGFRVENPES